MGQGGQAEFATRAEGLHHRVHEFGPAYDGIYRAGTDAFGAAYAQGFVYEGHGAGDEHSHFRVQSTGRALEERRERLQSLMAARRTAVYGNLIRSYRFCVRPAIGIPAAGALGLRQ